MTCNINAEPKIQNFDVGRVDILIDEDDWIYISVKDRTEISCAYQYSNGISPDNKFAELNAEVAKSFAAPLFDKINLINLCKKGQLSGDQEDGRRIIIILYDTNGVAVSGCHLSKGYTDLETTKLSDIVQGITSKLQGFRKIQPKEALNYKVNVEKLYQKVVIGATPK